MQYHFKKRLFSLKCCVAKRGEVLHVLHYNTRSTVDDNDGVSIETQTCAVVYFASSFCVPGSFTCVASNAAGEAQQTVELVITKLPHITNNSISDQEPDPGSSDIATVSKTGSEAGGGVPLGNAKTSQEKKVVIAEAHSTSALVKFNFHRSIPGIRMFQIQYNGTYDDSLVYR